MYPLARFLIISSGLSTWVSSSPILLQNCFSNFSNDLKFEINFSPEIWLQWIWNTKAVFGNSDLAIYIEDMVKSKKFLQFLTEISSNIKKATYLSVKKNKNSFFNVNIVYKIIVSACVATHGPGELLWERFFFFF